jgi:hypothetical protein
MAKITIVFEGDTQSIIAYLNDGKTPVELVQSARVKSGEDFPSFLSNTDLSFARINPAGTLTTTVKFEE